jgi:hypothetical protein
VTGGPAADDAQDADSTALTAFQIEVAKTFFDLDAAHGFLLAGGAALAAQRLTVRPTHDLDLFTAPGGGVVADALVGLERAAAARGWQVRLIRRAVTFARLVVTGPEESVLVDLAVDATPERPPTMSVAGPTLDPDDLAARKVIALFDRAEARDFADVYTLATRYGPARLLELAAAADAGFDVDVFADMLESLARFADEEIPAPGGDVTAIRAFAADWAASLRGRNALDR